MQTSLEETLRRFAPQVLGAIVRRFRDFGAAEMPSSGTFHRELSSRSNNPAPKLRWRCNAPRGRRETAGKTNGGAFRQLLMSTAGAGAG
jgi:predicted RNA polymerase sigma factor